MGEFAGIGKDGIAPYYNIYLYVSCNIMSTLYIEIDSFNPYDSLYINRKVVNRDVLILIKTLRAGGYDVVVKPKDSRRLEYLFKNGVTSFLADPANQVIITIPLGIISGLITNWIQKQFDKKKESNNIIIIDQSTNIITNSFNKTITKGQVEDTKKKRKIIANNYKKCLKTKSPFLGLPFPILLDHKPIIIGWCSLEETDIGLEIQKGIITNKNAYRKIKAGVYKGGSVTGIAKISTCNICNADYTSCNHIAGKKYKGKSCHISIIDADLIEVSVVKEPVNTKAILKLI